MEVALEAGASDVSSEGEGFIIYSAATDYATVKDALEAAGLTIDSSELASIPQNTIALDSEQGRKVVNLIEALEDNDDVQTVSHNGDLPDDVFEG